ncbi:hypothetical protein IHE44_0012917 [Lamprotornis superbus]|uniref:ADP-ribosyl cyclase/cyclic ADP-ribose hydrolase 1 n=1 Tax=Lamprotornis superbus TaxID=245042 RepID=A0A835NFH0_9PASS|nr:hypothetical protein IHE44_0012917 [Lamprotornis superbus]
MLKCRENRAVSRLHLAVTTGFAVTGRNQAVKNPVIIRNDPGSPAGQGYLVGGFRCYNNKKEADPLYAHLIHCIPIFWLRAWEMGHAVTWPEEPTALGLTSAAAPQELLLPPDGSVLLAFSSSPASFQRWPTQLPGLSLAATPKKLFQSSSETARLESLFWSKTGELAHRYTKSNQNFLTLEDTLLGYMADKVSWCGDPSAPGINYESCPKRSECESNPGSVFWKMASKMFAEAACGVVQVMLNGSVEAGAFRSSSIFGSIEVFNLDPDKVSEVHIWLMQDIGGPQSPIHGMPRFLMSTTAESSAGSGRLPEKERISSSLGLLKPEEEETRTTAGKKVPSGWIGALSVETQHFPEKRAEGRVKKCDVLLAGVHFRLFILKKINFTNLASSIWETSINTQRSPKLLILMLHFVADPMWICAKEL